jgi:3D (Asp-Asp-Asp) domain-containing protein
MGPSLDGPTFDRGLHGYVPGRGPDLGLVRRRPVGAGTRATASPAPRRVPHHRATATPGPSDATKVVVTAPGGGRPLGAFVVTCYDLEGRTASGAYPNSATVAVDPSVIPLGTRIYVAGVGTRIAEDTGGAIVGSRLDIWEPTASDCAAWGVQSRDVYVQD